ncbi:hypothetical protein, partial [uncultured Helicobacter sp.]|uniref:hypothetical protein n=1 Tax=uncultured Helicobacter sp. TaxID=175537 RepID=UPI0026159C5A
MERGRSLNLSQNAFSYHRFHKRDKHICNAIPDNVAMSAFCNAKKDSHLPLLLSVEAQGTVNGANCNGN